VHYHPIIESLIHEFALIFVPFITTVPYSLTPSSISQFGPIITSGPNTASLWILALGSIKTFPMILSDFNGVNFSLFF